MANIEETARKYFGRNVTRKRPQQAFNSAGQLNVNYGSTSDEVINVVIIKNYQENNQEIEGIKQVFPAKMTGPIDLDVKDYDLIETDTEIFQVVNSQIKANNITGSIGNKTEYFYCDLTLFEDDTIIE